MVDFSYEIINQIKDATDNTDVKGIIEKSIDSLSVKNRLANSRRKYMLNMTMALRYIKAEGLNRKATANVDYAIEVFEVLRKKDCSHLF